MFKPLFSRKLPDSLKPHPKTIFVVSAHTIARMFIIEKNDIHELSPIHTEDTEYKYTDKEGFNYVNNGSGSNIGTMTGFQERNKMHYDKVFSSFMVKEIEKLDKKYQAEKIIIYTPKDLKEVLIKAFPKSYSDKLDIKIGNHIKVTPQKLFDLLK